MRRQALVLVAAVALLLPLSPPAAAGPRPAVSGTTVLVGDATAKTRVRVPSEAVLDLRPQEDGRGRLSPAALRVSGGRGYTGFLLVEAGTTDGFFAFAARLPRPHRDGDDVVAATAFGQPAAADRDGLLAANRCQRCTVPPGVYDLYLVTRDRRATVTITFEGLSGRTRLRPERRVAAAEFSPPPHRWTAGGTGTSGGAVGLQLVWPQRTFRAGLLVDTTEVLAIPRTLVAAGSARSCRGGDGERDCSSRRLGAGGSAAVGGTQVSALRVRRSLGTSVEYEFTGERVRYRVQASLLWLPVAGSMRAASASAPRLQLQQLAHPVP